MEISSASYPHTIGSKIMSEEKLKFVGTYITENLYWKFRMQCDKKQVSASKALLELIMIFTKNISLEEISPKVISDGKTENN